MPKLNMPLKERIILKMNKTESCWLWTGHLNWGGYGCVRVGKKMLLAHRAVYALFVGEIPDNIMVLHRCDVRNCVNPSHLFLGTQKENMEDMYSKNRQPQRQAEFNGNSKLTWAEVYLIRSLWPKLSTYKLGKKFGVANTLIHQIVKNKIWKEN